MTRLLALCALATGLLSPALVRAEDQGPGASRAAVPPIAFTQRTLKNGLHVFEALDRSTPNVTVQVWYGVGSKNDPQSRSGFAHLFEHMMFKATRDMASEQMDRLTEDVGGMNNASTSDDFTDFYEVIPANQLDRLLWAEAERMSSLSVDQASFTSERAVVEEELRQSYLANPYGRLLLDVRDASYEIHPYKRSTIGSIGDLDAAGLLDVKAFHDTYYRPDNANLIVIGNYDQAALDAWIDADFADIAAPSTPIPKVTVIEPARRAPAVSTVYAPGVPLPAVDITWAIPAASNPDLSALKIADAILSAGDSSRLNHDLVYDRQIAQSIGSDAGDNAQPSLFQVQAVMAGGKSLAEGESALLAEVKALRETPVTASELARAKNQLVATALLERETIEGRAFELGRAIIVQGGAEHANTEIAALQAVTAQDVRRVAQTYLQEDHRVVVRYLDESLRPVGEPKAVDLALHSPKVDADVLSTSIQTPPPPASLARRPPAPGVPAAALAPKVTERTLRNGLRVIVAKTSDVPMVTAEFVVRRGGGASSLPGVASMTADLLQKGTTTRSASDIASEIEDAGGALKSETTHDASALVLTVLADQLKNTLPILSDVVRRPAFDPGELDRLRRQKQDDLAVVLKQPGDVAEVATARAVFGAGPYGEPLSGTPSSLEHITRSDVLAAYALSFRPDAAILVLTGDIEPEAGFALAEAAFGDWLRPTTPMTTQAQSPRREGLQVIVVDLPDAGQAAVTLAGQTVGRQDPHFYAVRTADAVLGGGYSARLNEDIRVKRGLSYGAFSRVEARNGVGLFTATAQTKNASAAEVAGLLLQQAAELASTPIGAEELAARKASLIGGYGRAAGTSAGLASIVANDALFGLDLQEVSRYPLAIQAVSADATLAAARLTIDPSAAVIIVVGDAKQFLPQLKTRFPALKVVSASDLYAAAAPPKSGR